MNTALDQLLEKIGEEFPGILRITSKANVGEAVFVDLYVGTRNFIIAWSEEGGFGVDIITGPNSSDGVDSAFKSVDTAFDEFMRLYSTSRSTQS